MRSGQGGAFHFLLHRATDLRQLTRMACVPGPHLSGHLQTGLLICLPITASCECQSEDFRLQDVYTFEHGVDVMSG